MQSKNGPDVQSSRQQQNTVRGIYFIVISTLLFSLMDGLIKWNGETYPVMQLILFRTVFAMIPILFAVWKLGGLKLLKTEQPMKHFIRGTSGMLAMFCVFSSFTKLPMAEVVTILFAAPILTSILAFVFLREKIGIHRGLAILIGFIGVMVIVQPGPEILSSDTIYPILAATFMATSMIMLRVISRKDDSSAIAFYFTVYGIIVSSIGVSVQGWVMPTGIDWLLLITIGLLGGIAQYFGTRAIAMAEVAAIAPFKYTALIWSAGLAYFIWGEVPESEIWIGATVIIGSSLYILHREIYWSRKKKDKKQISLRAKIMSFLIRA